MKQFMCKNLTYYYPNQKIPALKKINLSIHKGEFILVLGNSGSGKSTLGRVLNRIVPEFYGGKIAGTIESNAKIGMIFQDPEKQLVMDKVEREIAFGLENIGTPPEAMKKSVIETLSFLNLWDIKDEKTYNLSGGQKQKVAIGSILAMGYEFLVLDEPTSQLDPTSSEEILHLLKRLNEELGYTIVLIEQRVDRCFHLADRILFLESGEILFDGTKENFARWSHLHRKKFLPPLSDYFVRIGASPIPFTVKEGRDKLKNYFPDQKIPTITPPVSFHTGSDTAVEIQNISFSYDQNKDVLKSIVLKVFSREILGIMGQNGSGKSTLMKIIAGLLKPKDGKIVINGKVGYLSQNPNDYLFSDSVYEELAFSLKQHKIKDFKKIKRTLEQLGIEYCKDKNPRDLSSGEKQRVALGSILVTDPDILILDEPTRGLDRNAKEKLGELLLSLKAAGKTILLVTHDVEFAANICTRVCLIFDGNIAQIGSKYEVLTSGIFYTTQIHKLFHGLSNILTLDDALSISSISKAGGI